MSNKLNQVLDETDRIDKLNYQSLKELFVKQFFWKGYRNNLMKNSVGNPLLTQTYQNNLELLKDYEASYGLGRFILDNNCFKQSVKSLVLDSDNVVNDLYDKISKDLPESEASKRIKRKLKGLLNGNCGMPIHKILRGTIENCLARQELENE